MLRFAIRADASSTLGTGHVMRCLTLAQELRKRGNEITFVSREAPGDLRDFVRGLGFEQQTVPLLGQAEDADWVRETVRPEGVIVDHYELDATWEERLLPGARLLAIDDKANRRHACHALLDQNFFLDAEERYQELIPDPAMAFLGPRYALLRAEFRDTPRRERTGEVKNVLIAYGGSDPTGETLKAIAALRAMEGLEIKAVCGPSMGQRDEVFALAQGKANIEILPPTNEMCRLMDWADLSLGAGGSMNWERCHRGLPTLVTSVSEDQIAISRDLATTGAIQYLGHHDAVTADFILSSTERFHQSPQDAMAMSKAASELVPGDGVARVADWLSA